MSVKKCLASADRLSFTRLHKSNSKQAQTKNVFNFRSYVIYFIDEKTQIYCWKIIFHTRKLILVKEHIKLRQSQYTVIENYLCSKQAKSGSNPPCLQRDLSVLAVSAVLGVHRLLDSCSITNFFSGIGFTHLRHTCNKENLTMGVALNNSIYMIYKLCSLTYNYRHSFTESKDKIRLSKLTHDLLPTFHIANKLRL